MLPCSSLQKSVNICKYFFQAKSFTFLPSSLDKKVFTYIFISLTYELEHDVFTIKVDEITEEGLDLEWEEDHPSIMAFLKNFSQIDFDLEEPLRTKARVWKAGQSVVIQATVETVLQLHCVRCLKEFPYPLSSALNLTLLPSKKAPHEEEVELKEEEMESTFFEGGEIRLSEIACEQIFLDLPYQPLCDEACKGLCPVCGKDLNLSNCDCTPDELESGFSVLKKLRLN